MRKARLLQSFFSTQFFQSLYLENVTVLFSLPTQKNMSINNIDVTQVWTSCMSKLSNMVDERAYNTWFIPIKPISLAGETLTLQVPSQFFCEFLEGNYVDELREVLSEVVGPNATLLYNALVDNTSSQPRSVTLSGCNKSKEEIVVDKSQMRLEENNNSASPHQNFDSQLNPKLNFNNFIQGNCNKLARSIAESIADNPGNSPLNPFFIFGASGVGKTHLCQALGLSVKQQFPHMKVLYVSASTFEMQFTTASRQGTFNDFIGFYQQIDVLIIDDIQWLIGKKKTQLAFFQIFNHLYMLSKQIVLTSDKAPAELEGMEERLVSRMAGAIMVPIERPDLDLRRNILRRKLAASGVELPEEVVEFIAENVKNNIREIEGTVMSLITNSVVTDCEIDLKFTKRIVNQAVRLEKKEINMDSILNAVNKVFRISIADIRGKSRKQEVVTARHCAMYLAKKLTDLTLAAIGELLGGRNHATVLHGFRCVSDQIEMSANLRNSVEQTERILLR